MDASNEMFLKKSKNWWFTASYIPILFLRMEENKMPIHISVVQVIVVFKNVRQNSLVCDWTRKRNVPIEVRNGHCTQYVCKLGFSIISSKILKLQVYLKKFLQIFLHMCRFWSEYLAIEVLISPTIGVRLSYPSRVVVRMLNPFMKSDVRF